MVPTCPVAPRRRPVFALIVSGVCAATGAAPAAAQVQIYTDLSQWQAAAGNSSTDTLQAEVLGNHPTPYVTVGGWSITTLGGGTTIQVFDNGFVNGSREFHFRDFGVQVRFAAPNAPLRAMGLSYDTAGESWQLKLDGNVVATLPPNTNGFIGFTSNPPRSDFVLTSPSAVQGGLSVDNLVTPGCPSDFDHNGIVNSQDVFDYIAAFFADSPAADFNHNGVVNSQDFFDFLSAFLQGC